MGGRTDSRGSADPFLRFFRFLRREGFPRLGSRERRERDFLLLFRNPRGASRRREPVQGSSRHPVSHAKKAKEAKKARGSRDKLPDLPRSAAGLFDGAADLALALKQE